VASENCLDPGGGGVGILVFPDSDYLPAACRKSLIDLAIALYVPLKLKSPKLTVRSWPCPMFRAGMPKATVYEYRNSGSGKDNIGANCAIAVNSN
jgi:hypothetical protein